MWKPIKTCILYAGLLLGKVAFVTVYVLRKNKVFWTMHCKFIPGYNQKVGWFGEKSLACVLTADSKVWYEDLFNIMSSFLTCHQDEISHGELLVLSIYNSDQLWCLINESRFHIFVVFVKRSTSCAIWAVAEPSKGRSLWDWTFPGDQQEHLHTCKYFDTKHIS